MNKLKVATVFSGIGSAEFALKRMRIDHEILFACDNGDVDISNFINYEEEIKRVKSFDTIDEKKMYVDNLYKKYSRRSNFVKRSYLANYNCPENRFFLDVNLLDGEDFYNQVDIFIGGSPCQSFSSVQENRTGLESAKGTLFFEYARLVSEIKPKVFIYENVYGMYKHNNGETWKVIQKVFKELGYTFAHAILNSQDYGIPQNRRRIIVIGFRTDSGIDTDQLKELFPPKTIPLHFYTEDIRLEKCPFGGFRSIENDINITTEDDSHYNSFVESSENSVLMDEIRKLELSEKLKQYVLKNGTKTFKTKVATDLKIARTLIATMGNSHRAGINNYFSIYEDWNHKLNYDTNEAERYIPEKHRIRHLHPRETLRLMGFTDDFKIVVSRGQQWKQSGNSIVVDVLIHVFKSIFPLIDLEV